MANYENEKEVVVLEGKNVADLKKIAEGYKIEVNGTGKNGAVTRADLEKAILDSGKVTVETADEYVVLTPFTDLQDNGYIYEKVGESYPRDNKKADPERVKELLSADNKRKEPVIKVKDKE